MGLGQSDAGQAVGYFWCVCRHSVGRWAQKPANTVRLPQRESQRKSFTFKDVQTTSKRAAGATNQEVGSSNLSGRASILNVTLVLGLHRLPALSVSPRMRKRAIYVSDLDAGSSLVFARRRRNTQGHNDRRRLSLKSQ